MMFYLTFMGIILLIAVVAMSFHRLKPPHKYDSALKRRAIFNPAQQLTFGRLQDILPEHQVLAQVSFDTLLTTKYSHTRNKYQHMVADFVVLDRDCQVLAIVELQDGLGIKRLKRQHYQRSLLEAAGYKVLCYKSLPEYEQLRSDFLGALPPVASPLGLAPEFENILKYNSSYVRPF